MTSVKGMTSSHSFHAYQSPNKIRTKTRELIKAMLSIRSPKDSCWAESLIVLWLYQA